MLKLLTMAFFVICICHSASLNITIEETSCPANATFTDVMYNMPTCITEAFFSTLVSGFVYSSGEFLDNSLEFIVNGPDIDAYCEPYSTVMGVLESLYTIALMGVGAYYIASATDAERRAKAKTWIQNIFFMIILLAFSFDIFGMILDLNLYLTTSIYSESFSDLLTVGTAFSSIVFATIISFNFLLASSLTFFTLLVRYLMLPFLLLAFPVSIFLYFLPFTKEWGAFMVKFSLAIIFMTTIDAIVVLGMSYLFEAGDPLIADGFVNGIALMLGFGLIGLINLIIYAIAVLSLVMAAVKVFESVISIGWKIAMLAALL